MTWAVPNSPNRPSPVGSPITLDIEALTAQIGPDEYVVAVNGDVDLHSAPLLEGRLDGLLADEAEVAGREQADAHQERDAVDVLAPDVLGAPDLLRAVRPVPARPRRRRRGCSPPRTREDVSSALHTAFAQGGLAATNRGLQGKKLEPIKVSTLEEWREKQQK